MWRDCDQSVSYDFCQNLTLGHTRKFIPPAWYKGRVLVEPLPRVFDMLQYFETILSSVESRWSSQQDEVYLWVVALLEACDVTNKGRHLGFYQELEIRLRPQEMVIFVIDM